jgi:hypothetical protein
VIEYVLRFPNRDEIRLADQDGHALGDPIRIGGYDWIVEAISVPLAGPVSERIALRLVSASGDGEALVGNDQTLVAELTERLKDSSDGFTVVMPVGEWIDAHLWPASERAAAEE